jgi:hypothetical protein
MAQRFGGAHSPGAEAGGTGRVPAMRPPLKGRARASILTSLSVIPLVGAFFGGGPAEMAGDLMAAAAILGGGVLTREGLRARAAFAERLVARRPAIPRLAFGAGATGVGVGLAAASGADGLLGGGLYGAIAAALHVASFGLDPWRSKGLADNPRSERVARTIEEAEGLLAQMRAALDGLRDAEAQARLERVASAAEEMFRRIEAAPGDLVAARRYLGVYLEGARDATLKFAELWRARKDREARAEYLALLADLEQGLDGTRETLLLSDRTALDVEVEVLRERLARDGLARRE